MQKVIGILAQPPRKRATELLSLHDPWKLLRDGVRGVPAPEKIRLGIPVVMSSAYGVVLTIG